MRIEYHPFVTDMGDVLKFLPGPMAANAAKEKVAEKQKELDAARQEQAEAERKPAEERPAQATAGSEITGMTGNEAAGIPQQPGTTAAPRVGVTKTYFLDNFGMSGEDLITLMDENGEHEMIPRLVNLLKQEQVAVLKDYAWWDDRDWSHIDLSDADFRTLARHPDRLELPFRKAVMASRRSDGAEREDVWEAWRARLSAEDRLNKHERRVLTRISEVLDEYGDMPSSTLTKHEPSMTATEIASLIKSHGFLYDISVVGQGRRADGRTYLYGKEKPPIFLKHVDQFIAGLWDLEGAIESSPTGIPRISLPFASKRGEDYAEIMRKSLDVHNITWGGDHFLIEGRKAVYAATTSAIPHLVEKGQEAEALLGIVGGVKSD